MASGLGGLLATGQKTEEQAKAGLLGAARLEAGQDIAKRNLEMQKEAGQQQLTGTAVGIGAAYGANAAIGLKGGAAVGAVATPVLIALAAATLLNKLFD